jgi:hypothetical protein
VSPTTKAKKRPVYKMSRTESKLPTKDIKKLKLANEKEGKKED